MNTTAKIARFEVQDVVRSRWLIGYALFFLVVTDALLRFGSGEKALLSLVNVVLFVTPLVTIVFATVYQYNSREFIELLLAQPVKRRQLFGGLYIGLALPVSLVFAATVAIPMIVHRGDNAVNTGTLIALLGTGVALTSVFTAIAFHSRESGRSHERARGRHRSLADDGGALRRSGAARSFDLC